MNTYIVDEIIEMMNPHCCLGEISLEKPEMNL